MYNNNIIWLPNIIGLPNMLSTAVGFSFKFVKLNLFK